MVDVRRRQFIFRVPPLLYLKIIFSSQVIIFIFPIVGKKKAGVLIPAFKLCSSEFSFWRADGLLHPSQEDLHQGAGVCSVPERRRDGVFQSFLQ